MKLSNLKQHQDLYILGISGLIFILGQIYFWTVLGAI